MGEVLAVSPSGDCEVMACLAPQTIPFSIDWLPDGRLLIIDGPQRRLFSQETDGSLETVADRLGSVLFAVACKPPDCEDNECDYQRPKEQREYHRDDPARSNTQSQHRRHFSLR
jgi:hypothetical protein